MQEIIYLFDPLCGWCYGASDGLDKLAAAGNTLIRMQPTGLFARGGRVADAGFAGYVWQNDQKIAALTGLPFSEIYRSRLLSGDGRAFDSWAMTTVLTAVAKTASEREIETLKAFQTARYQYGRDTADMRTVKAVLNEAGLTQAASMAGSPELADATEQRILEGRALMRQFGLSGVPGLLVRTDRQEAWQVADSRILFA